MSARSPFFFSPLSPPLSFLFRVVSRLFRVIRENLDFGVVPVKTGKSSGITNKTARLIVLREK